jgi:hypothetical protein
MKLTQLNPCFVGYGGEGVTGKDGNPIPRREGLGLGCDCPLCGPSHPMFTPFSNPLDGGPPIHSANHTWERTGDNFENLTLAPSIQRLSGCKWHGYIRKGVIETV